MKRIFFIIVSIYFGMAVFGQTKDSVIAYLENTIAFGLTNYNYNPDSVMIVSQQAYEYAVQHDKFNEAAELLRLQGLAYYNKVDYATALDLFSDSRSLFKKLNDKAGEARALNNISIVYETQGLFNHSLEMDKLVLAMRLEIGDSVRIAGSYNNIAVSQFNLGKYPKALKNYVLAIQIAKQIKDTASLGLYYNNVGNVYFQTQKYDSASIYFIKALSASKKSNSLQFEANALNYLGELNFSLNNFNKAIDYSSKSLAIAQKIKIPFEIESAAENLSKSYEAIGNYKQAFYYHKLFKQLADSANNQLTMQRIVQMEAAREYEGEKHVQQMVQERERMESQLEIQKQKQQKYIALVVILAALFLGIFFYRSYLRKLKANALLEEQKEEILAQKERIAAHRDHISALNKTKDKFFAIIAHDLKNPLSGMHRLAEVTLQNFYENTTEKNRENLKLIAQSGAKTYSLLENLLNWARLQLGGIRPQYESFNLSNTIRQVVNLLQSNAHQKKIDLSFRASEYEIKSDPFMLSTIVRNLISNAIKFTPQGGRVEVTIIGKPLHWEIAVIDNGVGISESDLDNIFNPNTDVKKIGTSNEKGTGLGLMLCREFTELLGGSIQAESFVNKGTTFTVSLPKNT